MIIVIVGILIFLYLYSIPYVHAYTAPVAPVKAYTPLTAKKMVEIEFVNVPVMIRIAKAESGFNEKSRNPHSTAKGVYQILDGTWKAYGCKGDVLNAEENIACARIIYERDGTVPWNSSASSWKVVK